MNQYLIIHGNAVDGFDFVGPFKDTDTAVDYAESCRNIRNDTWVLSVLQAPEENKA